MTKRSLKSVVVLLLLLFSAGCVKLAFRLAPSLIPDLTQAIFEECDPELAKQSIPADIKLMEGFLRGDPENRQLLTALSMGFTGYAMLFVEDIDPERASRLYLRAKYYGLRALGRKVSALRKKEQGKEAVRDQLRCLDEEHLAALFWTTMSWNAWINLNLDKPEAFSQLAPAEACLKRIMELKADYFYGTPYVMKASLAAARPPMLGGDKGAAKLYFEKAASVAGGKFFLVHYFFAKLYAVRAQDKTLFVKLIEHVKRTPPDELKEICLINAVMKEKMEELGNRMEELFF